MSALVSPQGTYCFPWLPVGRGRLIVREFYRVRGGGGGGGVLRIIFS